MNLYQRVRIVVFGCICLVITLWAVSVMSADQTDALRPTMQSIFQVLTNILPLSLNEDTFAKAENRPRIQSNLRTLAQRVASLASHGDLVPPSFDFLQRSLSHDAQDAVTLFEAGDYEASRLVFQQLIDNCFLCHSQVPSAESFSLGLAVLELLDMDRLSPHEQVRVAVAARQFDVALTASEMLFQSLAVPAVQIDIMAFFEDYLRIALRVQRDVPRAINALETFLKRPDVPHYLNDHISTWVKDLKTLARDANNGRDLHHARALIQQGQQRNRFLADRHGLIYFTIASSNLHRYVSTSAKSASQLAEAYYLLSVADSYIARSS